MKRYTSLIRSHEKDLSGLLYETTFNLDKDINFIYNKVFNSFLSDLNKGKYKFYTDIIKKFKFNKKEDFMSSDDVLLYKFDSNILKTSDSKKANSLNQIIIYCGLFDNKSYYQPKISSEKFAYIQISINKKAVKLFFNEYKGDNIKYFNNYLTEKFIKSTISHELSHWVDDSLHKGFLTSLVDLAQWLNNIDIIKLDKQDVNLTYFEINAQIHGIKTLKNMHKYEWNDFTLKDIFLLYSSLSNIAEILYIKYGDKIAEIWQKYLMKRMARENLLGKNMRNFVKFNDLEEKRFRIP